MKIRNYVNGRVVWFNKAINLITKDTDGNEVITYIDYDNFAEDAEYVKQAITQKLSIIRNELWYSPTTGIPLGSIQKVIDTYVIRTILSVEGVNAIIKYMSTRSGNKLSISVTILYNNSPLIINI